MQFRNLIVVALLGWGIGTSARAADAPAAAWMGVGLQDISAERAKALKIPEVTGVEVTSLFPNTPAAAAGLKLDDVITQFNGRRVEDREQFARMVLDTPIGGEVKLQIYRNGVAQIVNAKLLPRPAWATQGGQVASAVRLQPFPSVQPDVPLSRMSWGSGVLGAELESLEGQLADYFGVKDGVLVRSVIHGSTAEKAGLKAGDVITRVGDAKVTTPADVSARIRAARAQSASLALVRDHREMSLSIVLDGSRPGEQQ